MKKKVYICSQYSGNVQENLKHARMCCLFAVKLGYLPIAPHIYFTQFLNDDDEIDRNMGIEYGKMLLEECEEIWICSKHISKGMQGEIDYAKILNLPCKLMQHIPDVQSNPFEYDTYAFIPVGKLPQNISFNDATRNCKSDVSLGITNYNVKWKKAQWDCKTFINVSDAVCCNSNYADIFLCVSNGKYYIPANNELFEYTGSFNKLK